MKLEINIPSAIDWSLLTGFDYFTIIVNILMFFFAKKLIVRNDTLGIEIRDYTRKVQMLRLVNIIFFCVHAITIAFNKTIGETWIQSYLLVLFFFISTHWINHWILMKYGDHETVDGIIRVTDNYLSQILRLSIMLTSFFIVSFGLIHVWNLRSLLESGSALVTIGIIIFATKDYWLEEVLASFTIHAKGKLKRGSVIRLDDNIYIVLETNFIGTRIKNHKTDVELTVPNSRFVREKIKLLSIEKQDDSDKKKRVFKPIKEYIHFKIGYDTGYEKVKEFFDSVIEASSKECAAIKGNYTLNIFNNGDHAVEWEVIYYIDNPYAVLNAKNTINLQAFLKQEEFSVSLSTPITHTKIGE